MTAQQQILMMKVRGKVYRGGSFAEMSKQWDAIRDALGFGASKLSGTDIMDKFSGKVVARVSYNGRIWAPGPWSPDAKPIYDNRA